MGLIINPFDDRYHQAEPDPGASGAEEEDDGWLSVEQMRGLLERMVERNEGAEREARSQRLLDRTVKACLQEGELELGLALGVLHAGRVAGQQRLLAGVLLQLVADIKAETDLLTQRCRVCGCTNERACPGGCHWVEFDLCSRCV